MRPFAPSPAAPADPAATHGAGRLGGVGNANEAHSQCEWGTVADVQADRYTYTVRTLRGRMLRGVPRKRMHPSDVALLPVGTSVIVRHDLGLPIIDGVLDIPLSVDAPDGISATGVTGYGGQGLNQSTSSNVGNYRGPAEPTDLVPGDMVQGNRAGARVGVLEGGVALLQGSPLGQVRAFAIGDLVEILSRNYRHVTDMGVFEVKNQEGRVNMSFRGASDQLGEAGSDEENWTIRLDMGAVGDLFDFQITTPQGQPLFRLHVDANGRCDLFGQDGVLIRSGAASGEPHVSDHAADVLERIGGDHTVVVAGDAATTTEGNRMDTIDGAYTVSVGSDHQLAAVRDLGLSAGRNAYVNVVGARDGTPAMTTNIQGGDWRVELGQPQYPLAGYRLRTTKGKIRMESTQGGDIELRTRLGELLAEARKIRLATSAADSVILGGNAVVGHVAVYEPLEQAIRILLRLIDLHSHPTTSPGAPTGVPLVPMTAQVLGPLARAKSRIVGVGG